MRKLKTLMADIGGMRRNMIGKGAAGLAVALSVFCLSALSCYAVEGKVTAETAKIRAQTSTDSEVVGSTQRGKTIDILEAVKDSAGSVWYKVSVSGGGYGYIRSDLVETSAAIEPTSQSGASQSGSSTSAPAETTPTSIGEQPATITSSKNANIRSGASTQHSTVATLPNGTGVTLIGEATDNAGNKWYQISCTYNDKAVQGYVRSDLITLGGGGSEGGAGGESPEGTEGENPEGTEGENPEGTEGTEGAEGPEGGEPQEPASEESHNDYEIVYTQNETGEYEYYLYNNIDGTRQKLNELLSAISIANESNQQLQDQMDKGKIIIIVLAGVIVLLFIVLTILLFKIRELYYGDDYEDEEDEEEEEEPEPEPVKKKRRKRVQEEEEEEEEEEPPVRKKRPRSQEEERPVRTQSRSGQPKAKGERELHALENKEPVRKQPARKPQNFLVDDDEFEFEFLNMDDKDL